MNAFAGPGCGDPPGSAQVLTDVLNETRRNRGETRQATSDGRELDPLVSGTQRLSKDKQDARRFLITQRQPDAVCDTHNRHQQGWIT